MEQNVASEEAPPRDPEIIKHYHAHIYYDPATTREKAARLRRGIEVRFPDAVVGRWHDEHVGPHLQSMFQVAFATEMLGDIMPWLMLNRDGLSILVHPGTDNGYLDHTQHAAWLGAPAPLKLRAFKHAPKEA